MVVAGPVVPLQIARIPRMSRDSQGTPFLDDPYLQWMKYIDSKLTQHKRTLDARNLVIPQKRQRFEAIYLGRRKPCVEY